MENNIRAWDVYVYILNLAYEEKKEDRTYLWCLHLLTYFYYEFKDYDIFKYEKIYLNRIGINYFSVNVHIKRHFMFLSSEIDYKVIENYKDIINNLDIKIKDRVDRLFYKLKDKKCYELSMGIHRRFGYWYTVMKKYIVNCKWDELTFNKDTKNGIKPIYLDYKSFINHKEKLRCI